MKLLLSPHNDDEALFASYICLRERPLIVTCLNGNRKRHYPTVEARVAESKAAAAVLGCEFAHLWAQGDPPDWEGVELRLELLLDGEEPEHIWAPLPGPNGQPHHNRLAKLALQAWPGRASFFDTYYVVNGGPPVRSTHGIPVAEEPGWADLKRAALACYRTQIESEGTRMHFEQPLEEYEAHSLRLNLGGGINPIPGFVNIDKSTGWMFEQGLDCYPDGTVEAITVSHVLMYVALEEWPGAFAEMARVLRPGGSIRITEDAIGCPGSNRPRLRPGAAVETNPPLVLDLLAEYGIDAAQVEPDETAFSDRSLIQQNYGAPPDVFHVEGVKAEEAA